MKFLSKGHFLWLAAFIGGSAGALSLDAIGQRPSALITRLTLPHDTDYYGTAILLELGEREAFFITPAHVLPNLKERAHLQMRGVVLEGLGKFAKFEEPCRPRTRVADCALARIVAVSPGEDLAVLKISLQQNLPNDPMLAGFKTFLDSQYRSDMITEELVSDGAFLGYRSYLDNFSSHIQQTPGQRTLTAKDWLYQVIHAPWEQESQSPELYQRILAGTEKAQFWIRRTHDCPYIFVETCFEVNARSWGFSGAALVLSDARQALFVVGMATHYNPGSAETYVLPMSQARQIAGRLRAARAEADRLGKTHPENVFTDATGTFSFDGRQLKVLRGELAGKSFEAMSAWNSAGPAQTGGGHSVGGGGHSVGGGGHSVGGGGHSVGGGGHSVGGGDYAFPEGARRPLAPLGWDPVVAAWFQNFARSKFSTFAHQVDAWEFLMSYQLGIREVGQPGPWSGEMSQPADLSDFVQIYLGQRNPERRRESELSEGATTLFSSPQKGIVYDETLSAPGSPATENRVAMMPVPPLTYFIFSPAGGAHLVMRETPDSVPTRVHFSGTWKRDALGDLTYWGPVQLEDSRGVQPFPLAWARILRSSTEKEYRVWIFFGKASSDNLTWIYQKFIPPGGK